MASTLPVHAHGHDIVDDLLTSFRWSSPGISFGFAESAAVYGVGYGKGEASSGFAPLNPSQVEAARQAISKWQELVELKISEVDGGSADIRIAVSSAPKTSWAYLPNTLEIGGDVWIGAANYNTAPKLGNYAYLTIMHEIGHALGLDHPHEGGLTPAGHLHAMDAMPWSVMSYRSYVGMDINSGYQNETWGYAQSPMARDIAAIQHLYGANYQTRAGDTVYAWDPITGEKYVNGVGQGAPGANKVFETIWDGGGRDTFDFSASTSAVAIDLTPGAWSVLGNSQLARLGAQQFAPGNVATAYLHDNDPRAYIENAVGGAAGDTVTGNAADNLLEGGNGADKLNGAAGDDILVGGRLPVSLDRTAMDILDFAKAGIGSSGDGDDMLIGGGGNDIFVPGGGHNSVFGDDGLDTMVLSIGIGDLSVSAGTGSSVILSFDGGDVIAAGAEYIVTTDGVYAVGGSVSSAATSFDDVELLYQAALGRAADEAGAQYWRGVLASGESVDAVAEFLISGPEFAARFGTAMNDDSLFVAALYNNALGRSGGQNEVAYWSDAIVDGVSRAGLLTAFALSEESKVNWQTLHASVDTSVPEINLVAISEADWLSLVS